MSTDLLRVRQSLLARIAALEADLAQQRAIVEAAERVVSAVERHTRLDDESLSQPDVDAALADVRALVAEYRAAEHGQPATSNDRLLSIPCLRCGHTVRQHDLRPSAGWTSICITGCDCPALRFTIGDGGQPATGEEP